MARLLLIANPAASGFTGALHRDVLRILGRSFDVVPLWPGSAEEARYEAAQAAAEGIPLVAAMGGDGVVHHVANGLIGTNAALGIIPTGTTNVFARILDIPVRARRAATHLARSDTTRTVPAARVIADLDNGGRLVTHAVFALGIGLDADIVHRAELRPRGKLWFGGFYYARTALSVIAKHYRKRPANLRVETAGHRADGVAALVQVHGRYTYLGPRPLGMTTDVGKGVAVLTIERVNFRTSARLITPILAGRPLDGIGSAHVWTDVGKLVVEADPPARLQADGESLGSITTLELVPVADELHVAG